MIAHPISAAGALVTNGFEVVLPETVEVLVRDFPDGAEVKAERERVSDHWFVHWFKGMLYYLRLKGGGVNVSGRTVTLRTREHPWLLRSRLEDSVAEVFHKYEPLRRRPFTFLAQKQDLVATAAKDAGIDPSLLDGFRIRPRYRIHPKIYELADGCARVGIFVTINMHYDIDTDLNLLQDAKVDLAGLHLVRRQPEPGQRRHLGQFERIDGDTVWLCEAHDDTHVALKDAKLEGSKENFARCLKGLLGQRARSFDAAMEQAQTAYRLGPDFDTKVEEVGKYLARNPIPLGLEMHAQVGRRITITNDGSANSIYRAPPVDYVYDRTGSNSARFAWRGLLDYGPYDRDSFPTRSPRLLVVFPKAVEGKVNSFLASLRDGMGRTGLGFEQGFVRVFAIRTIEFVNCPVDLNGIADDQIEQAYRDAITDTLQHDHRMDAAIVVLQDRHAFLPGLRNPYLRTKALLMTVGIPAQEIRVDTLNKDRYGLSYTLQNFSVALYAKLNGTPWTVNQDRQIGDELVVGMGFAELSGSRIEDRQRHVGITTVFSGDGTYVLGNVSRECAYDEYPEVVRTSMLSILRDVKQRNNWQPGDRIRVVFHAHRPLKRVDIARIVFQCTREVGSEQDVQLAFVTVTHDHPFMLLDRNALGVPIKKQGRAMKGVYAPDRGTIAQIGRSSRLLAVNSGNLIKRANAPLPKPLLIRVDPTSTFTDVDYLSEQVLKFTSLSWRSTLPVHTPVTIFYSERIAELLGRLRDVPQWSTTPLNVKLRYSRWFL